MVTEPPFHLTTRDHAILQALFDAWRGPHGPYSLLLGQKLRGSALAFSGDIGRDVVTLGSRIAYTVDGRPAGPHVLAEEPDPAEGAVSISTLRGLGLLGLTEGSTAVIELGDGAREELHVVKVLSQPEAEARLNASSTDGATVVSFRPRARPAFSGDGPEDDDPGPFAA